MKKINALVVDDSMEFTNDVKEYFQNNVKITIKQVLEDGNDVIPYLTNHLEEIDMILMDIVIPGKDGIYLLEELEKLNIKKNVIVLSSYGKDYTLRMIQKFNVDYFMLKPCSLNSLEARMKEIVAAENTELYADKKVSQEIQVKVSNLLHDLGVPSQIKGFQYLR